MSNNSCFQQVQASLHRRGVTLEIQQPGMARRMRNSSRSEGGQQRRIAWRIEWHFPAADVTVDDRRCISNRGLLALLRHSTSLSGFEP